MNSFFLSRSLPPKSEGSAEHSEAIGASVSTQVKISYVSVATYPFRHPGTAYSFHFAVFQKKYFSFCHCFITGKRNTFFIFYRMNYICFVSYSAGILPLLLR